MFITCLDMEGVLTPEIWENVAISTGIDELMLTTRDEPDYDKLMKMRLKILRDHEISLKYIQNVISQMNLLQGAKDFMDWLREASQVIILTGSFIEFAKPLIRKLGNPTVFCHNLLTDKKGMITDYVLRIRDMKRTTVKSLNEMNFEVIAVGDSYNDTGMLKEARYGILFRAPENVIQEFSQFPVVTEYSDLKALISKYLDLTSD